MKITAELNQLRMAPRKVRLVCDAIRGKSYAEAELALRFLTRRARGPVEKLLKSAAANARHNFQVTEPGSLVVSELRVDQGVTIKRRRARARGRAFPIRKRASRITLVLEARGVEARRERAKPAMEIVREAEDSQTAGPFKAQAERSAPRQTAKTVTKPTSFVQRMFRRKAI